MASEEKHEAPGYMTYREAAIMFSLMPEPDAAKAIKATVNYYLYGALPDTIGGSAEHVFKIMKADIDRNNEKYQKIAERNRSNINKRWSRENTSGIPNEYHSNTNPKPETINYKHKASNGGADKPPARPRFVPPTVEQVAAYVKERGSRVDPQGFVDFYSSKGWMVGKTPMKDWKAACRNAESWERWNRAGDTRSAVKTAADYDREDDFLSTP